VKSEPRSPNAEDSPTATTSRDGELAGDGKFTMVRDDQEHGSNTPLPRGRRLPRSREDSRSAERDAPTFYSVATTARILGMSEMTLYRAIHDGQFPAIRIRGRLIVPARVIDAMTSAALEGHHLVDAEQWARPHCE
jgi:excisionase family DNA binding protein